MNELPSTERRDPASARLGEMPAESAPRLMNDEDRKVPEAATGAPPGFAAAADLIVEARREERRWIYAGAGASGRIVALDTARPSRRR